MILSTMMTTNMGGGDGMNLVMDLTAKQKKKVEKALLKDRVESQIDLKKVLRQQLDDHNRRLKSQFDEKKGEEEKIMADRERRKVDKLTEQAMVKDSDAMIKRFNPEKPSAVTTKIDKVID